MGRRQMRAKGNESSQRMLGMLLGSQAEVLVKAAFTAMRDVVSEARMQKIRAKGDASSRRMLTMLLGSQSELLVKTMFSAWWDHVAHLKQEQEVEKMSIELKSKSKESSKR